MEDFHRLNVWHRAHALALDVHRESRAFPPEERFALTNQMRRAATSVPFNIAEACGRKVAGRSNVEPLRFLAIAAGSLQELASQIEYARDVGYLSESAANRLLVSVQEVAKMLSRLIVHLRRHDDARQARG